jgi:hypothetical protein
MFVWLANADDFRSAAVRYIRGFLRRVEKGAERLEFVKRFEGISGILRHISEGLS